MLTEKIINKEYYRSITLYKIPLLLALTLSLSITIIIDTNILHCGYKSLSEIFDTYELYYTIEEYRDMQKYVLKKFREKIEKNSWYH